MTSGETLAAAAHLHVLLRRKTGRVTDTEWMASNRDYARAMIAFARQSAASDGHAELLPLAGRLEDLMALVAAPAPVPAPAREPKPARSGNDSTFDASTASPGGSLQKDDLDTRYIGRLR